MPMMMGKRVAVMQPYFLPYAGYFRLLAVADEFLVFDCVQFPRRGRVHRTEVPAPAGGTEWLTLPLASQPRDVAIRDLRFAANSRVKFDARLARHGWIENGHGPAAERVRAYLRGPMRTVTGFVEDGLRLVANLLDLDVPLRRTSSLGLAPDLRGEERVIAAAAAVGARRYVNAPGGRVLYNAAAFEAHGIELSFLPPYVGRYRYLLPALLQDDPASIRADIMETAGPLSK